MNTTALSPWTCLDCAAEYPIRVGWCTGCGARGRVLMLGRRPRAELDAQPEVADAASLARLAGDPRPLAAYPTILAGHGALAVVVGESGGGKSTASARILDAVRGPVLYVSAEEGLGPTLAQRLARLGVTRRDFHLLGRASVDQTAEHLRKTRAVALAIDSVQAAQWEPRDLRHLLAVNPRIELLLAVCQVNARGRPEGRHSLIHEADLVLAVEQLHINVTKSRYQEINTNESRQIAVLPVLPRGDAGSPVRQTPTPIRSLRLVQCEDFREGGEDHSGADADE
ncbi:MAG: repair protein rada [Gemmatimonadota bacterium]|jgi:hypothetical protein